MHETIKEELPDVKPAAETILEPVSDQTKPKEAVDAVGVQEHTKNNKNVSVGLLLWFYITLHSQTIPDTKEEARGEEDGVSQSDLEALITGQHPKEESPGPSLDPGPDSDAQKVVSGKWVCAQSSQSKTNNFNKHITDKLEVLAKAYTHQGDKWRALSYSKAVNALKSYHKPVTSYQVNEHRCSLHYFPGKDSNEYSCWIHCNKYFLFNDRSYLVYNARIIFLQILLLNHNLSFHLF